MPMNWFIIILIIIIIIIIIWVLCGRRALSADSSQTMD